MNRVLILVLSLCLFSNCSKEDNIEPTNYIYYYPTDTDEITAASIGDGTGTFDPKGIAISNDTLYVCNGNVLEIFDAITLDHIKTITHYKKGDISIQLSYLSSISIDNGRIYIGSTESRLFVLDEATTQGITTVGNGQWWQTFVHVFGVVAEDDLVFVKEKNNIIKVFEASQINDTSDWNLAPYAKLNTLTGYTEIYSMDVVDGQLVVAGRNANSYLYYNIDDIKAQADSSLTTPIEPTTAPLSGVVPTSVIFNDDWSITSEASGGLNYLRIYSTSDFLNKDYNPFVNASDIMGENSFGSIVSVAKLNDLLFLSDNSNKKIRVIKLNEATISER
ncbi:hypothetical protein V6R21_14880 [Limibacter armeniacum]|uniref:hypothetical protein n=1 Tax=Limibacter armeniacum TaxID=466084 RepID=UPI002FE6B2E9